MNFALANLLLLVMVLLEVFITFLFREEKTPWRDIVFNLNSGHILMWVLRGIEVQVFYIVLTHFSLHLLAKWSYIAIWVFAFVAWDFCFYWLHRLHHKYRVLWAVHVVHHEGEHFNLSLGIRNSWYSSITSIPFFIVLAIIGTPIEIFVATSSIHYFIQFYNHNHLVKKSGWLEKIMITPSHHKVHHGINPEYLDKNFGGAFVFWDKLFGTFQKEEESIDIIYGTKNLVRTENVLLANNRPFLKMLNLSVEKIKKRKTAYHLPDWLIGIGGVLLFLMLLYYIHQESHWNTDLKIFFFCLVFIGTISNGGLSEGKYWGLGIWLVNSLFFIPMFIISQHIYDPILLIISGLLIIHSMYTLLIYSMVRNNK